MRYNFTLLFIIISSFIYSQNKTVVEGVIVDEYNYGVPYAAIGILSKNLGTSSNDEGAFYFLVTDKAVSYTHLTLPTNREV